jgi:hypothetical protein
LRQLPAPNRALIVCVGSGAWERGRSPHFYPGFKVVLPPGDDPAAYRWNFVCGSDVLILPFGELEPLGVIARLAGLLLAAGAGLIVYCPEPGRGSITRFDARRAAA